MKNSTRHGLYSYYIVHALRYINKNSIELIRLCVTIAFVHADGILLSGIIGEHYNKARQIRQSIKDKGCVKKLGHLAYLLYQMSLKSPLCF